VVFLCLPHNSRIPTPGTNRKPRSAPASHPAGTHERTDLRLGQIIRLLADHATVVVSGSKIAAEIGASRSEVWRLIQQLRHLGVEIAGHPATGYQLKAVPDLLLPEMIAPLVRGTIFSQHIHHYYKIGSTNVAAADAAGAGAPEGSVFLAEQQTAGRGRGGHSWHSAQSDGIYCSVILRPAIPPSGALIFALAAGLAVREAVHEIDPKVSPDLKWPNDLLIAGKKFCGILTEMNAEVTRVRHMVVGIGINVNHASFPPDLETTATSLRLATRRPWSRVELCAALLKSLHREYQLLAEANARDSIINRFREGSSSASGRRVRVEENGVVEGITDGLDSDGFLLVRTANGVKKILSGTVQAID
jgi:BirA family transcriptional regulator, biotin operon repressor / biotin---[acetyl-CoA-carboxylase] ligase